MADGDILNAYFYDVSDLNLRFVKAKDHEIVVINFIFRLLTKQAMLYMKNI